MLSTRVVHSGRAMLWRPLGLSQTTLARPSHCVHTLWSHIEVITAQGDSWGRKQLKTTITNQKQLKTTKALFLNDLRLFLVSVNQYFSMQDRLTPTKIYICGSICFFCSWHHLFSPIVLRERKSQFVVHRSDSEERTQIGDFPSLDTMWLSSGTN